MVTASEAAAVVEACYAMEITRAEFEAAKIATSLVEAEHAEAARAAYDMSRHAFHLEGIRSRKAAKAAEAARRMAKELSDIEYNLFVVMEAHRARLEKTRARAAAAEWVLIEAKRREAAPALQTLAQ